MNTTHRRYTRGASNLMIIIGIVGLLVFAWLLYASFQDQQIVVNDSTAPNQAEYLKTQAELDAEARGDYETVEALQQAAADAAEAETTTQSAVETTTSPDPVVTSEPASTAPQGGQYIDYDESALTSATNVIFFHATWCPSCRALETDITRNLGDIPDNVTILKADYDTETALKQKYGVTNQHTLVVVDENGNKIRSLTGLTNTLAQVVGQL